MQQIFSLSEDRHVLAVSWIATVVRGIRVLAVLDEGIRYNTIIPCHSVSAVLQSAYRSRASRIQVHQWWAATE